ncbi:MAG: Holliday junction resolvase RuvX [Clostridia bacterium]|nr:Holliday junction resolvase RuvX [Clostridia bacterium]
MHLKRLMALDYGDVRIGVAISDLTKTIASGLETYKCKNLELDLNHFANLAKEQDVEKFIIGLPLNMDGTEGLRAEKTRAFGDKLSALTALPVEYVDERLTSVEAEEILISAGMRREKRKEVIDKLAATLILKSYLKI